MIRLTVLSDLGPATQLVSAPFFRITGSAVWIGPTAGADAALVRYVGGLWEHGDTFWSGMRFEGWCRLVFGLPREPSRVSDEVASLSIHGGTMSISGIPFAVYDDVRDMWRGVGANTWWHAFRIESSELREPLDSSSEEREAIRGVSRAKPKTRTLRLDVPALMVGRRLTDRE